MWANGSGTLTYRVKGQMGINHTQKSSLGRKNFSKKSRGPKLGVISWALYTIMSVNIYIVAKASYLCPMGSWTVLAAALASLEPVTSISKGV